MPITKATITSRLKNGAIGVLLGLGAVMGVLAIGFSVSSQKFNAFADELQDGITRVDTDHAHVFHEAISTPPGTRFQTSGGKLTISALFDARTFSSAAPVEIQYGYGPVIDNRTIHSEMLVNYTISMVGGAIRVRLISA